MKAILFIVIFIKYNLIGCNLLKNKNLISKKLNTTKFNNINSLRSLELKCDKGYYLYGEDCFKCYENCLECNGIKCTKCEDGYFPNEMNCFECYENCLKCDGVQCTKCMEGYYPIDMDCFECYENCIDCDGIKCNKCVKGYYPYNMDCYRCYENCLECDGIQCLECQEGYLPFKMSCFSGFKNTCNKEDGFYMLKKDYILLKQNPDHMFICLKKEDVASGYFVNSIMDNNNIYYFWDSCSTNCFECEGSAENNCVKCDEINYYKLYEDKNINNNFKCYEKNEKHNYFIYEEDSVKYLRKCADNCLTCNSYSKEACTSCDNKNYFLKYDDIPNILTGARCFNQIELPSYYLYMNQYFKECIGLCSTNECDKSCINCLINDKKECLTCNFKESYYPLHVEYNETKGHYKCYLKSDFPHYYLNETDKTLVECSNNCNTCINNPTFCISCAKGAFFAHGLNNNKCYFKKPDINWIFGDNEWQKCYERCNTCYKQTNSDFDQQCTSCNISEGFFPYQKDIEAWNQGNNKFKITGFNCYNRDEIFQNYFLHPSNLTWTKCSKNCSRCENNPDNCLICNNDNEYYNIKYHKNGSCFKNPLPGYILDSEKEFNKCFRTCKYCQSTSNSFFYMQCKECDEIKYTLANDSYEKSYCIPKDNSSSIYIKNQLKWYITGYNNSEHYKIYDYEIFNNNKYENFDFNLTYNCPSDKPFLINSTRQCVSKCSNPNDLFEYGLFFANKNLYLYNNICYDTCPLGSYPDSKTMTCVESNIYSCEDLRIKKEFNKYYQNNVDIYLARSANNTVFQIESSDFTNYFYNSSTNDSWKYELNMPIFNFDECISRLEEKYNYSKNEIHIGIFQNNDLKRDIHNSILLSAINSTSYKIFLSNGTILNFSICNGMKMEVKKPIDITLIENFEESLELLKKYNLSIFNQSDEIFNDICIPLELGGKDLSIYIRQNRLKSKINVCDNGCNFLGFDYNNNYSLCECKIVDEENSMGFKDFMTKNFEVINKTINLKEKSNIIIFKCLVKTKFDNNNYIFYLSLILIVFHFIILFLFLIKFIIRIRVLYKIKENGANIIETNTIFNSTDKKKSINKTMIFMIMIK